jgi:hypothetical protein
MRWASSPSSPHLRRRRHHIGGSRRRQHRHRAVHREVDARVNDTGGDQALIASGTTPKMLANENQACFIGYGGMLMESFVAIMG